MRRDTVILLKNFLLCSRYDQQVFISVSKSKILFCFCYAPIEIHFPNFFHVKVTSLFIKLSYFVLRLTSLIPPKFIPSKHFPLHYLHDLLHTGNVNDGGCAGINFTLMEHFAGGVDQQKLFKTKISCLKVSPQISFYISWQLSAPIPGPPCISSRSFCISPESLCLSFSRPRSLILNLPVPSLARPTRISLHLLPSFWVSPGSSCISSRSPCISFGSHWVHHGFPFSSLDIPSQNSL